MEKYLASTSRPLESGEAVAPDFLSRTVQSSLILARILPVGRTSVCCRVLLRGLRSLSGSGSWVGQTLRRYPATTDFPATAELEYTSWAVGSMGRGLAATPSVWRVSAAHRVLGRMTGTIEPPERVQLVGMAIAVSGIARVALVGGAFFHSFGAVISTAVVIATGVVMLYAAEPIVVAWRHWRR